MKQENFVLIVLQAGEVPAPYEARYGSIKWTIRSPPEITRNFCHGQYILVKNQIVELTQKKKKKKNKFKKF